MWMFLPALMVGLASCGEGGIGGGGGGSVELKTQLDSVSYGLGMNMGKGTRPDSIHLNLDAFARGYRDGHDSLKLALTDSQAQGVMQRFQEEMGKKMEAKAKAEGEANEKAGAAYLAENKKKPGVIELPSGVQYEILTPGTEKKPAATDQVQVLYKGTLTNGTVFDSATDKANPVTFAVNGVIPGWTEALQLMGEGAKWRIVIPAKLAYGANPQPGGKIKPNATLIFEVELLKVLPPQADAGGPGGPGGAGGAGGPGGPGGNPQGK